MRERNLKFYLANMGIEVERMFQFRYKDNEKFFWSVQRFLDLFSQVVKLASNSRKSEILKLKEVVLDYFFWDNIYKSTEKSLKNYFKIFYF